MDTLRFDRDRDTLRLSLTSAALRKGGVQVEVRRAEDHEDISAVFINDSLGVAFPGNLVNPFEQDSGKTMFRGGAYYLMTVALADSNYFGFARSFSDPITGRGFLNYLKGGLGVFGSIETAQYMLRMVGTMDDPKEGVYRITGRVGTTDLNLTLEAYLDELYTSEFSAFAKGAWFNGSVDVSGDGEFGFQPGLTQNSPDAFQYTFNVVRTTNPTFRRYVLRGVRSSNSTPFTVQVIQSNQGGTTLLNVNVTGVQISGPGR